MIPRNDHIFVYFPPIRTFFYIMVTQKQKINVDTLQYQSYPQLPFKFHSCSSNILYNKKNPVQNYTLHLSCFSSLFQSGMIPQSSWFSWPWQFWRLQASFFLFLFCRMSLNCDLSDVSSWLNSGFNLGKNATKVRL